MAAALPENNVTAEKQVLRTKVIFPDYFRDHPLVMITDATDFVLLFNHGTDVVNLVPTANWNCDGADLALWVTVARHAAGPEPRGWSLRHHPATPSRARLVFPRPRLPPRVVSGDVNQILQDLLDGVLSDADVFVNPLAYRAPDPVNLLRFSLPLEEREKTYTLMLSFEKEAEEEEDAAALLQGEADPSRHSVPPEITLMDLPEEILLLIVDRLDPDDVIEKLPYVCQKFFELTKMKRIWRSICFGRCTGGRRNGLAYCELARGSCEALTVGLRRDDAKLYVDALVHCRWENLRFLRVVGSAGVHLPLAVKLGVRRGNFPKLERLVFLDRPEGREYAVGWTLAGCPLPCLKELTLEISAVVPFSSLQNLFAQYSGLRVLALRVLDAPGRFRNTLVSGVLAHGLADGRLPNLEKLNLVVVLDRRADEVVLELELGQGGGAFVHEGLKTFMLDVEDGGDGSRFGAGEVGVSFDGGWLFPRLPNVETLVLGARVKFDWASSPEASLAALKRLKFSVAGATEASVPFDKMSSLTRALITFPSGTEVSHRTQLLSAFFASQFALRPDKNWKLEMSSSSLCFWIDDEFVKEPEFEPTTLSMANHKHDDSPSVGSSPSAFFSHPLIILGI